MVEQLGALNLIFKRTMELLGFELTEFLSRKEIVLQLAIDWFSKVTCIKKHTYVLNTDS